LGEEILMSTPDRPEYDAQQLNKRRTIRAPLIVEKVPCEDGQKTFFGYAKNVSRGGLFISTVKPREPGEKFLIELTLPTKPRTTISCDCEVVWKQHFQSKSPNEPGMGLRFINISDADGDKIDAWVTELTTVLSV
jgi:uncharacterized protein (TIGR02266 family)